MTPSSPIPAAPDPASRPAALLWDFDGTLADTEPIWIRAEYDLIGRLGGRWSDEHALQLVGNSLIDSGIYIVNAIDRPDLDPAWVMDQLVEQVVATLRTGEVPWRPGALALLEASRVAGVPCALVSASYRVILDAALAALPPGSFTASVAGDEVTSGKPHPEPYERACAELGVDARDCVAFEDSETGARSANAAGALVVAVPNHVAIPAAPRRVERASLADVDLAGLASLLDEADALV
ncbi:haloacid dehalogenase superfamily, subfamily IA, variant 3 with third motif having DD or ED [Microlunatus sagamiharensis]|uniref:Haloacid dehalogenase superfamily, subfamily IA, variant 3 with third motif having DD or ED n=1 Tax=Microlunatus sagamiharensis TaxID=546874 RepID=A0A1H2M6E7_9ACTN|nr:HAD family phosphatase [Microlunatus sagamiharensis]SDU88595.1 haloacid dehalogenase superfamily, subfamily IA, variant 3 with third motif having DD or ED [Microlunatus sagamiharensis]